MGAWTYSEAETLGGRFQLVISKLGRNGGVRDVTTVRNAPTSLDTFSDADPFGDSTATFTFPAITAFDDLNASDLGRWLAYFANVDLYWVPAIAADTPGYGTNELPIINALTNLPDVIAPTKLRDIHGNVLGDARIKLWEGFIASMDFTQDQGSSSLQIQCQGALFQVDRYLMKPFFPATPWPLEDLIKDAFSHTQKPHLRTQPLKVRWPTGWKLQIPKFTEVDTYTLHGKPGSNYSGYASRQTGSWDHALTGFVQDQLTVMLTDARSQTTPGNQWTISHQHHSSTSPGRQPILQVRDRYRTPDLAVWLGAPGVQVTLSGDSTQSENIIYGDGTGVDGTVWRNAVISNNGARTDYKPLAASRSVYPQKNNHAYQGHAFVSEAYTKFSAGFDQPSAVTVSEQTLVRDREPGWTGTITLSTDPSPGRSRWLIRAGMTILLQGFAGSGVAGVPFHISSRTANPMDGTVELTVDTRYRDLLTVEEAQSRTRDPLTPVKMLQVNRQSVMVEDIQAPWDYSAGAGFIPRSSKKFYDSKPLKEGFPYTDWHAKHPPLLHPEYYVKCTAGAPNSQARWSARELVLTSEKGTIAHSEFSVFDLFGRRLKIPFHVSLYYGTVTWRAMPHLNGSYSAYQNNAFEKVDPTTGEQVNPELWPDDSYLIGWGNQGGGVMNRAGFSPGRETNHSPVTGLLTDDSPWTFDQTSVAGRNGYFQAANPPGKRAKAADIALYAMFYAEYKEPVYFAGRIFRQNPGGS